MLNVTKLSSNIVKLNSDFINLWPNFQQAFYNFIKFYQMFIKCVRFNQIGLWTVLSLNFLKFYQICTQKFSEFLSNLTGCLGIICQTLPNYLTQSNWIMLHPSLLKFQTLSNWIIISYLTKNSSNLLKFDQIFVLYCT